MKNLVALEIFAYVGKLRSFTKAAEQMGLTKSTVSRHIQSLEKDLGIKLIKRDPRHFALTDEGSVLLKRTESILSQTEAALDEIAQIQTGLRGKISISTTADLSLLYLADTISKYSINHPEIEFVIDLTPKKIDLFEDGVDMVIRPGHPKDSSLYGKQIDEIQKEFFVSPIYLERYGRPKNFLDLKNHKIISTDKINLQNLTISPSIKANNMSLIKQLTLRGAGIGLLSEKLVTAELKASSLIHVLPSLKLPGTPIFLLYPNKNMPKRISIFIQEIQNSNKK